MKTYSISEWRKLFIENKKKFSKGLSFVDEAFVAFNANLDYIYRLNNMFKFERVKKIELPSSIKDRKDLTKGLLYSFTNGKAIELKIENKELYNELLNELDFDEIRMGGQMGIVANTLSKLGVKKVVVFSNLFPEELAKRFESRVYYPMLNKGKIILNKAKRSGFKDQSARKNIIIEFKKGQKIVIGGKSFVCPRNNRFIISSPDESSLPIFPTQLIRKELFSSIKRIFVSGYHHVDKKRVKKVFKNWIAQINTIRTISNSKIHLEYVDIHKEWMNKEVIKLLSHINSLGLNEVECCNLMNYCGNMKLHNKIKRGYKTKDLIEAGLYLIKRFGLDRVAIHTLNSIIVVVKKEYEIPNDYIVDSVIFAIRATISKLIYGNEFAKKIDQYSWHINKTDSKLWGQWELPDVRVVIVPNLSIDEKPRFTVGLGDTISSISFYGELLYFKSKSKSKR